MVKKNALTREEKREAFREINERSDRFMNYALFAYFAFGIILSFFYNTLSMALGVGGTCLALFFITRYLLPISSLYQYVMSALFAIFSAQFIYQMHGLFEMHFFFFVGSTLLITFRNWKLMIPIFVITVVHHMAFAWLQYQGMKEIYFTQLDYMNLQAFIFHALLAAVIMGICGYWAYDLEQSTWDNASKNHLLGKQLLSVKNNIAFAERMSKGDLQAEYTILDQSDELGKALKVMQENLVKSNDRETKDKFITVGITRISEIIRHHANDPQLLADKFINQLVRYMNVNQGALFLHHENEDHSSYLQLSSCYAYQRKKHIDLKINPGEGLVGQCFVERDEIYLTQVPQNYVRITSGLGEATPTCILLVPVKTQDAIVGVIEVASFRALHDFEKQFVHRAAENIASAIVSSRTTERIKKLLAESEQRGEVMRSQEEEMRQNIEELAATQEEMNRKANEMDNRLKAIDDSGIGSVEFTIDGIILDANRNFLDLMGYSLEQVRGKHHRMFVQADVARSQAYEDFWNDLRMGIARPGEYARVTSKGQPVYIRGSYSIIKDQNGRAQKILKLAYDVTALKMSSVNAKRKFENEILFEVN